MSDPRDVLRQAEHEETEAVFTIRELARHWRVSEQTIYRMVWGHEIPAQRIRGQWRIHVRRKPRPASASQV